MSVAMDDVTSNENEGFKGKQSVISKELESQLNDMDQFVRINDQETWRATPQMSYTIEDEPFVCFLRTATIGFKQKPRKAIKFDLVVRFEPLRGKSEEFVKFGIRFFNNSITEDAYYLEDSTQYNLFRSISWSDQQATEMSKAQLREEGKKRFLKSGLSENYFNTFLETFERIIERVNLDHLKKQ